MDSTIPWGDYAPEQVEALVSAWLVRTIPGGHRVDGSGGDDGADVRAPVEGGLHVFEIKSFHRRLTTAQKRQILRSLEVAVDLQPLMVRWTLVLPLDFSPAENRWFDQSVVSFTSIPINWIGRTEIEESLSQNRDLLRSFAPGSVERRALDLAHAYRLPAVSPAAAVVPASFKVGEGDGEVGDAFQAAYAAAGGVDVLGEAQGDVTWREPGYFQRFAGGPLGDAAVICGLPGLPAAVVPVPIWLALYQIGGGPDRGAGVAAAGLPVARPTGDRPIVVDPATTRLDLGGGSWREGHLVRTRPGDTWRWQPEPRIDFHLSHLSRWIGPDWADLRVRAIVDLPWLSGSVEPEVTTARRRALQAALAGSEFATVFRVLSLHRGARVPEPKWETAKGNDTFNSDRSIHLRAQMEAADGRVALSGEVLVHLPDNVYSTSFWGCVELRVNLAAWRAVLDNVGAGLADGADLRLTVPEVIEALASAWGTAAGVAPLGAVDDPSRMALAGPPYVEMHIQTSASVVSGSARHFLLSDVVDLSALGEATRDNATQQTGMRVYASLDIDRAARRAQVAKGLAQLGRAWGYIDADGDRLLAADVSKSR